ncbi:12730_t:CDS:1, partial [Acaulospora morrowiae]
DFTKWTPRNFDDLKNTLQNCIPHIRFFQMLPGDYSKVKDRFKDILPDGLDNEITEYFSNPNFEPSINILPLRKYPFESNIIHAKDTGYIASWIDKRETLYRFTNLPFKFKLIYRASRDGFGIENFHKKCDEKGPTVVVIKAHNSEKIIGGYNPFKWGAGVEKEGYILRSRTFLFSLKDRDQLSRISTKKEAIFWYKEKGPCFGLRDLRIISTGTDIICKSRRHSYEKKIIDNRTFKVEEYE